MDINVFTAAMRNEFNEAWAKLDTAPAPWMDFTTEIPSTARVENYSFMSPAPGLARYQGHRRLADLSAIKYQVSNLEYDAAFAVLTRDIEDDKVGGYTLKPGELAKNAKEFPGRIALQLLGLGASTACFDGTNFFADSHTIGTGDNSITKNCASDDSQTHYAALLYTGGGIKPLIYQNRKPPTFLDDADDKQSRFNKQVRYWVDMEGAAAFGYWWDACLCTITDTPTVTECQSILADLATAFRGFYLEKATPEEQKVYIHEQTVFSTANATLVVSARLGELFRQVLTQPTIVNSGAAVTNIYNGFAKLCVSNYLGT